MANVEKITAKRPEVKPSRRMVNVELTRTFPKRILHSKKLPLSRTGWIIFAYLLSFSVPVFFKI